MADEDDLRAALTKLSGARSYQAIERLVERCLDDLVETGAVLLGPDHELGAKGLEARVKTIFAQLGWRGVAPSTVDADLVVAVPTGFQPNRPLVIEVKSGKGVAPDRNNLRQLDDWVFELSGESNARKKNFVAGPMRVGSGVITSSAARVHPSPHKGVFIYNGPLGTEFVQRSAAWLGPNEIAFAEKRNFCVLRLETLIAWSRVAITEEKRHEFWKAIQETAGVLRDP